MYRKQRVGAQVAAVTAMLLTFGLPDARAEFTRQQHVEADLVADTTAVSPGVPLQAVLRFRIAPHWHTYWRNPGDSGLPPDIEWDLPDGFTAGPIQWPYPYRIPVPPLANYGYKDESLHLVEITPAADLPAAGTVTLSADVSWLVCEDVCIPESGRVSVTLPVATANDPAQAANQELFEAARERLPRPPDGWSFSAGMDGGRIVVVATPPADGAADPGPVEFFAYDPMLVEHAAEQVLEADGDGFRLTIARSSLSEERPERLAGVLVAPDGWHADRAGKAVAIDVPLGDVPASLAPAGAEADSGFLMTLLFGFLGGLILNLMPCVFPVIGLKIMGFVKQAGETRGRVVLHGVLYSLGVLISFWILAGVLIAVRAGGAELGWGFQLQSPMFVFALAVLLLVFALNLSGLFEVGVSLTGAGQGMASKSGLSGSFFSGILATVMATPCAAPFLAPALGAALALEPWQSLVIFTCIGIGLALPYLLLSMFPRLVERLPRPGPWMETFKQGMAFLLYGTVAYLAWVLAGQLDDRNYLYVLLALVLIGMAGWVYGRWSGPTRGTRARVIGRTVALLLLAWALLIGHRSQQPSAVTWEKWSPETVAALRTEDRVVYVDFTARWCATCQANKATVFTSDAVIDRFRKLKVAALKADWTSQDPAITRALADFGRSAVPFNLIYKPGEPEPVILPELLTPGIVLEALGD